jgi:hypothetical protein
MPSREHLRHAAQVQTELWWGRHPSTYIDVEVSVPGAILTPSLVDLDQWAMGNLTEGVTCDIEDIGVMLGIGFCRIADEVPIWIPIRTQGGGMYWAADELPRVIDWIQWVLDTIPLVMHNGQAADVPWLARIGFTCAGYEQGADTMLMAHLALPELPKGLQFLSTLWCRMPNWKKLVKGADDDIEEVSK